jgi:hypothetical protein
MTLSSKPHQQKWLALGLILLLALALRGIGLEYAPQGLRYDENLSHVMALRVMAGEWPIYFHESWGREPLYFYGQAVSLLIFGESIWAMRLPSALVGTLAVLGGWLLGRKLFGERVGWLTAVLIAVSFWAIFYARLGSRVGTTATIAVFSVYCLWQALDLSPTKSNQPRWHALLWAIGAGVLFGANVWVYVAGRMGFALWLGLGLYLLLLHRPAFRRRWWAWLIAGAVGAAIAFPLLNYLQTNPQAEQRLDLLNQPLNLLLEEGDPWPVLELTAQAVGMYVWQGEQDWLYNVFGRPIFDALTAVVFLLGLGLAIWQWRDPRYVLLLGWMLAGTLPAMLAPPAASLTHTIYAQPAALMLVALGLDWLWRKLDEYRAPLGAVVAIGLLVWYGLLSFQAYFLVWRNAPEVRELYQGGITAVAHDYLARHPQADQAVLIAAPYIDYWHPWNAISFDMAAWPENPPARWFNPAGALVWTTDETATPLYLPTDPLGAQTIHPYIADLLAPATDVPLADSEGDFARVQVVDTAVLNDRLAQLIPQTRLSWPPDLAHQSYYPEQFVFNEQLALLAVEPLHEGEVTPGQPISFATYWEVQQANPEPIVAFVHLTSDGVDIWGQQDWLDVRMAGLQPGDRFVQLHHVYAQPDTPAGTYFLQLGLYHPATGQRLLVTVPTDTIADRVWVGEVEVVTP